MVNDVRQWVLLNSKWRRSSSTSSVGVSRRALTARPPESSTSTRCASARRKPVLLIRTPDLLKLGTEIGVEVQESTLEEALQDEQSTHWTEDWAYEYLMLLYEGWPDHSSLMVNALDGDGRVSREDMADQLQRDPEKNMSGVGKPYVTAVRRLLDYKDAPEELEIPFVAHYDGGWMDYFEVPSAVLPIFRRVVEEADAAAEKDALASAANREITSER